MYDVTLRRYSMFAHEALFHCTHTEATRNMFSLIVWLSDTDALGWLFGTTTGPKRQKALTEKTQSIDV